ncbi:MAG: hypothetical protein WCY67_04350 [Acidithiobacillus sp.]
MARWEDALSSVSEGRCLFQVRGLPVLLVVGQAECQEASERSGVRKNHVFARASHPRGTGTRHTGSTRSARISEDLLFSSRRLVCSLMEPWEQLFDKSMAALDALLPALRF